MELYTIGHSNRSAEDFLALLKQHAIQLLIDVRKMPRSRFNPHFNEKRLRALLADAGIAYEHMPELGGMRAGGIAGYAEFMQTDEGMLALNRLLSLAEGKRTAYMCAEREPTQCHRHLISDALVARDIAITHIVRADECYPHILKQEAQLAML